MEVLKKTILQIVTTGTTITGGTVIIPDLTVVYNLKIGLKQSAHDLGFMDAYIEEEIPTPIPPVDETFYILDSNGNIYYDPYDNKKLCY